MAGVFYCLVVEKLFNYFSLFIQVVAFFARCKASPLSGPVWRNRHPFPHPYAVVRGEVKYDYIIPANAAYIPKRKCRFKV